MLLLTKIADYNIYTLTYYEIYTKKNLRSDNYTRYKNILSKCVKIIQVSENPGMTLTCRLPGESLRGII